MPIVSNFPSGASSKSIYEYAIRGGYTGTEEEFQSVMGTAPWLPLSGGTVNGVLRSIGSGAPIVNLVIGRNDMSDSVGFKQTGTDRLSLYKVNHIQDTLNGSARLAIADPVDDGDATTKRYVDSNAAKPPEATMITLPFRNWFQGPPTSGRTLSMDVLSVPGVLADESAQLIQVMPASDSIDVWRAANVRCVSQAEGSLQFYADSRPTADLSVYVVMQEVKTV